MNIRDRIKDLRRKDRAGQLHLRSRGGFHGKNSRAYSRRPKHKETYE